MSKQIEKIKIIIIVTYCMRESNVQKMRFRSPDLRAMDIQSLAPIARWAQCSSHPQFLPLCVHPRSRYNILNAIDCD